MNNFEFLSSTKIVFGKDCHKNVGQSVKKYADKILLHYGSDRIKKSGLYNEITSSLKEEGVEFIELSGVVPNPRLSLVYKGIDLCRENGVQLILAVGGGSVIDSAKAISMGTLYDGDVWDFFSKRIQPPKTLPVMTVLTIPAAGSESSPSVVITKEEGLIKRGYTSNKVRPVVSFLNPDLCKTLPDNQVVNGVSDIMAHIMERYFTNTPNVDFSDRLCEGSLRSVMDNVREVKKNKDNYDSWAEIMWCGSVAHNGLLGMGREEDWASHGIEHELSAIYDIAHGAGLSIVFPAWMKYVYKTNINRFAQFAIRVLDVDFALNDMEKIALEGISRLEQFYKEIGLPIRLSELDIDEKNIPEMAKKAAKGGTLGNFVKLTDKDIENIYRLAL